MADEDKAYTSFLAKLMSPTQDKKGVPDKGVTKDSDKPSSATLSTTETSRLKNIATVLGTVLEIGKFAPEPEAERLGAPGAAVGGVPKSGAVGANTEAASKASSSWGGIGMFLKALADGVKAFANPMTILGLTVITLAIMGLAKAFAYASPGFVSFGKMIAEIYKGVVPMIEAIGDVLGKVLDHLGPVIKTFMEGISMVIGTIGKLINDNKDVIQKALDTIGGIFFGAFKLITDAWGNFNNTLQVLIPKISGIIDSLGEAIRKIMHEAGDIIATIGKTITGTLDSIYNGIAKIIDGITKFRTDGINATTEQIEKLSAIPAEKLLATAQGIEAMKEALAGFSGGLWSNLTKGIGSFFGGDQAMQISSMADALYKFKDIPVDLLKSIGPAFRSIGDGLTAFGTGDLVGKITGGLGSLFGDNSPFDKLIELGKASPEIVKVTDALKELSKFGEINILQRFDSEAIIKGLSNVKDQLWGLNDVLNKTNLSEKMNNLKLQETDFSKTVTEKVEGANANIVTSINTGSEKQLSVTAKQYDVLIEIRDVVKFIANKNFGTTSSTTIAPPYTRPSTNSSTFTLRDDFANAYALPSH